MEALIFCNLLFFTSFFVVVLDILYKLRHVFHDTIVTEIIMTYGPFCSLIHTVLVN